LPGARDVSLIDSGCTTASFW